MKKQARNQQSVQALHARVRAIKKSSDHPVEEDPAAERGERIHTGKMIARGGKETGYVEGATENPPGE